MPPPAAHLFEFNDTARTPRFLREAQTDALRGLEHIAGVPVVMRSLLGDALEVTGARRVVDLCSGGTGPLLPSLRGTEVDVVCTDLYPSRRAARLVAQDRPTATYWERQVDATNVPAELTGLRTVINALHHFPDDLARDVLGDAAGAGQPILVVEVLRRQWLDFATMLAVPLGVLAVMPFVRPSLPALACTYALPLVPIMVGWDGIVSCLRSRSTEQLLALTDGVAGHAWTAGTVQARMVTLTWMLGVPE